MTAKTKYQTVFEFIFVLKILYLFYYPQKRQQTNEN